MSQTFDYDSVSKKLTPVKTEKEKMSKDPDYIQDIIDPEDFNLASGGIAGQLHLNQGGVAWPAGRENSFWANHYKQFIIAGLEALSARKRRGSKQDPKYVEYLQKQVKELKPHDEIAALRFEKDIQSFLPPTDYETEAYDIQPSAQIPETRSADRGLSNILRV